MRQFILFMLFLGMATTACSPTAANTPVINTATAVPSSTATATPSLIVTTIPIATTTTTSTPQPRLVLSPSGPDLENFAPGTNPLTGLGVQDAALLDLPAVLVSISNMPPTARPQAGTAFAPWIYELFIGEGTTRFMGVFYGDMPRRIPNPSGDCAVNTALFNPAGAWIGNRVWLDENKNGFQDPWEAGVGGVCVTLVEADGARLVASTSSDSNGYYAFDAASLQAGKSYTLIFQVPRIFQIADSAGSSTAGSGYGNDDQDSDANPLNGQVPFVYHGQTDASLDIGLILITPPPPTYSPADIAPERTYVGPIRSGRLTYNDFVHTYPAGCLVYASAGDGIRQQLDGCEIIFGEQPGVSPNTALLDVSHLKELAQKSKIAKQPVNYSGHLFDPLPPAGGYPASSLWTYFHAFSQASWHYDPISGSYLRQTDDGDGKGLFHNDSDRLTGRQLAFENVVIILADYNVFRHGQYDVALCCGLEGFAFLFRDGKMYKIRWSTNNRAWERETGLLRPLHFTGADKQPFPLKPGRTWVSIMTINSVLMDLKQGDWKAYFVMPNDLAPKP